MFCFLENIWRKWNHAWKDLNLILNFISSEFRLWCLNFAKWFAPLYSSFQRPPPGFKVNQKLEVVDKRNPSLVRAATIAEVNEYRLRIHFDGWDDIYDDWFEADSLDLYPVGWCEKTGHPLETPLSKFFV